MGDEQQRGSSGNSKAVYVIPALRHSGQKQSTTPSPSQRVRSPSSFTTSEDETPESLLTNSLQNLSLQKTLPAAPSPPPSSEDFLSCCLLVFGFSPSLPIETKERLLSPLYLHSSAKAQWLQKEVILFAYSSNQKMLAAFRDTSPHLPPPLHSVLLTDASPELIVEAESVAKELVKSFKPEIDSRVANRMITAALGLRRPAAVSGSTTTATRTQRAKPAPRAPSPPRADAWDD
jgi:hypothetical protein